MSEIVKCPACHHPNPGSALICAACGAAIVKDQDRSREARLRALATWTGLEGLAGSQEAAKSYWFLSRSDHANLKKLLETRPASGDPVRRLLAAKVSRGLVCDADQLPRDLVMLGSHVDFRFRDDLERCVLADPEEGRHPGAVSVLSALGTLLLGLFAGRSLRSQAPDGTAFSLVVEKVRQPERSSRPAVGEAGPRKLAS